MDVTAVVFHKGALAHYTVEEKGRNGFVAQLVTYGGDPASSPPANVSLQKSGRHCTGNVQDEALLDDIYYAAKEQLQRRR